MTFTDVVLIFGGIAFGIIVMAFAMSRPARDQSRAFTWLVLVGLGVYAVICLAMFIWFPLDVGAQTE